MRIVSNQRGDTIVEVLVALVILGTVLTGAFSVSNLSARQIRMAQERTEGQKAVQTAVESLNGLYAADNSITTRTASQPAGQSWFCRSSSGISVQGTVPFGEAEAADPMNPGATPAATCRSGSGGRYHTAIASMNAATRTFKIVVSWDGLNGRVENVTMFYRIRDVD